MNNYVTDAFTILVVGLLAVACQQNKKTETTSDDRTTPAVATLLKTTYNLGDSISIQLSQPLTHVEVVWENKSTSKIQPVNNTVVVLSVNQTVGLHQLVVKGITADRKISDTLEVELWSDIKPQNLHYSVVKTYPHQSSSFTQGLEFYGDDLYEGTGLNGQSTLMKVNLLTSAVIQSVSLPAQYFGAGITIVNNRIYQLTWTSGTCFRYTMDFSLEKTFAYPTQGWGLTHKDSTLILSDGSNKLSFYTPDFQKIGELTVYDDKGPVMNLNELEYVNGYLLANVWKTNRIVQIDLESGKVLGELEIDSTLPAGVDTNENVLNGIAFRPQENALYITGKNWPSLFKIQVNGLFKAKAKGAIAFARTK